jgi:hypothetical protein
MDLEFADHVLENFSLKKYADDTTQGAKRTEWDVILPTLLAGIVGGGGGGLVGYNFVSDRDKDNLVAQRRRKRNALIGAILGGSLASGVVGSAKAIPYIAGEKTNVDLGRVLSRAGMASAVGGGIGAGSAALLGDDPVLMLSNPELAKKKRRQNLLYGGLLGAGTGAMLMSGADLADQVMVRTGVLGPESYVK